MKKALPNIKVTVKLRRSNYKEEWYLIIESSPVYKRGSKRASRVVEGVIVYYDTPSLCVKRRRCAFGYTFESNLLSNYFQQLVPLMKMAIGNSIKRVFSSSGNCWIIN